MRQIATVNLLEMEDELTLGWVYHNIRRLFREVKVRQNFRIFDDLVGLGEIDFRKENMGGII